MDRWDVLIILAAGYVAVMALVRLMAKRRNQVLSRVQGEVAKQRQQAKKKTDSESKDDRGAA